MSPSQHSNGKALSEAKSSMQRPPSHPGPQKGPGKLQSSALPPKAEYPGSVKRTNSHIISKSQATHVQQTKSSQDVSKATQIRQQNVAFNSSKQAQNAEALALSKQPMSGQQHYSQAYAKNPLGARSNSVSRKNELQSLSDVKHAMGDNSLFGQFANENEFRPAVQEICEDADVQRTTTPG